jgi:uncharacterized protein DUF6967
MKINPLDRFRVPLTGQEIVLQEIEHEGGGMMQVRVRIRERTRFTIVDLDPLTAAHWGSALLSWAKDHAPAEALERATQSSARSDE